MWLWTRYQPAEDIHVGVLHPGVVQLENDLHPMVV